jgi:osmoprotectant transport system ATP-binding protein
MGDRIIILREGGILAQYDTPEEILARPADDFVARFVGADRGLKRLSLSDLSDLELLAPNGQPRDAPRAELSTSLRDALSLMLTTGGELVVVDEYGDVAGRATIEMIQAALRTNGGEASRAGAAK